ncbi:S8 family serine peptidase [Actinomadura rudentiformis]|uniref:S8 family serine peptidase n=1 Tax=Actinomadura rudentiformis TaxID=359158 RepID=UPI00178C4CED|nr:S8 family serine peptidase [Actinomadura rudentiformis]
MGVSHAGRRRSRGTRPVGHFGVRATASLTALTLAAAVAVPMALAPDGSAERQAGQSDHAGQPGQAGVAGQARVAARGAVTGVTRSAPDQIRQREWHLDAMHIPRAWKWSKGLGVTVAVLDTGVDKRHPDLVGRVTSGPDLTGGTRRPGGKYWGLHGTSMASIIAGHGNGPGYQRGVIGVAPQSRILSIRVTWENDDPLRGNGGTSGRNRDAVAQGIRYAVDHGAEVINMSLGGGRLFYDGDKTEEEAVRYALSKGVVLIASAGNDGAGSNRRNYPAAYDGVIAVGALDHRGRVWKDSNRRSYVAVCAPGVEIVSADASNGYVVGTGTSPSSAIAAGVAALVRARYPKLTPDEIRQALIQGSVPRQQASGSTNCPGTLDAARTLLAANKINKSANGPGATPKSAEKSSPVAAEPEEEGTGTLVMAVVAGGAVLVIVGLVLGWRQRRRPDEDFEEDDYLRHSGSGRPREPVGAMTGGGPSNGPDVAPVNVPLWQSSEVFPGGMPSASPESAARMGRSHASPSPEAPTSREQTDRPLWPPRTGAAEGQERAYGPGTGHRQESPYSAGSAPRQERPYGSGNGDERERPYGSASGFRQESQPHDLERGFGSARPPRRLEREYGGLGGGQDVERGDELERGYGEKRGRRHKPDSDEDRTPELGGRGPATGQNGGPGTADEKPPFSLGDLRPYHPGEPAVSDNGRGQNGSNGLGALNGFGGSASNGHGLNGHALDEPTTPNHLPDFDSVPREEDAEGPTDALPLPPADDFSDELPTAAFPAVPPADLDDDDQYGARFPEPGSSSEDQPGGRSTRRRPEDDDDYRPPWW